ncbi:MAG: penicillin-binding protein 2 [Candidatus Daviesbacteria bacterium]
MRVPRKKLGFAFTEEVLKITQSSGLFNKRKISDEQFEDIFVPNYKRDNNEEKVSPWRLMIFACFILVIFFGLFLRLFHLQIIQGKENRERADSNRIQIVAIHAPRGVIYDRNGKILADNKPGFRIKDQFISRDKALELEAKNDPIFEQLEIDAIRSYPFEELTAHVLGYVGQLTKEELVSKQFADYKIGDRVGRSGVEQVYETTLRGIDGAEIIEIDASGKKLRALRTLQPKPGKNINLSLDIDLQKVVYQSLKEEMDKAESCCGVALAEDPKSGEILSLVSLPSFDGNVFTDPEKGDQVSNYFEDPSSPMLNRAIAGTYPPGSTFKITTALSGLSLGKITPQTQIEDTGIISLDSYTFANWAYTQNGIKEGLVNVVRALQRSNDIFFYRVGGMVGVQGLGETAKKLGMGKRLGIDLPGEAEGLVPDEAWKKQKIGEVWYPGDNFHLAIGQGFLLTTPLQILAQTQFIANEGSLIQPHLVTKVTSGNGATIKQFNFKPINKDIFKKEDIALVKEGLSLVPKEGGTAWPFFGFSIPTAGKTGTAEYGDPKGKTHAWYTSFAPLDDPKIVTTILIEGGGEGSSVSAPVAKQIYNWFFSTNKTNLKNFETAPVPEEAKKFGE